MVTPDLIGLTRDALEISILIPALGTLAILFGGPLRAPSRAEAQRWPGILSVFLAACSFAVSIFAALGTRGGATVVLQGPEWIPGFGRALSLQLDSLGAWLLLLLEIVGLMVLVFSLDYMHNERDQRRYFGGLLFFITMMKLLILADSYLLMFAGWEGVGLASYVLIGYHFERPLAAEAATKAFIVNRIADAGFILGIIALASTCGSTSFQNVAAAAGSIPHWTMVFICSMLAIAAMGKSAQFPLHIWLPDAMEGPTPVSALIHSATMVCAGVYLLARSSELLMLTPEVGIAISILGCITALLGASVALAESDIKRVLAYSTISQIGFMFIALGVGDARAGMFHVVTHAFFKSLLFLAAGSVIHALQGDQNLDHMGGLRKQMPVTFWAMCIGGLTLAAIPGSSAFFTKDLILEAGLASGHRFITVIGLLTSLLTAFYGWRLVSLVFFGAPRRHRTAVHEAPPSMRVPMAVLASCCVLSGWMFIPKSGLSNGAVSIMLISGIASVVAVLAAWYLYVVNPGIRTPLDRQFAPFLQALRNRWYIDAVYEEHIVEGFVFRTAHGAAIADSRIVDAAATGTATLTRLLSRTSGWIDSSIVDGLVRGAAAAVRFFSWPFRAVQAGFVQTYILFFVAGAIVALAFCLTR